MCLLTTLHANAKLHNPTRDCLSGIAGVPSSQETELKADDHAVASTGLIGKPPGVTGRHCHCKHSPGLGQGSSSEADRTFAGKTAAGSYGSIPQVQAVGKQSVVRRWPSRRSPTTAVLRTAAIRATAGRHAQRLLGASQREYARQQPPAATDPQPKSARSNSLPQSCLSGRDTESPTGKWPAPLRDCNVDCSKRPEFNTIRSRMDCREACSQQTQCQE